MGFDGIAANDRCYGNERYARAFDIARDLAQQAWPPSAPRSWQCCFREPESPKVRKSPSHTIDAEPKIPRGGTALIMSVHGVVQAEARSSQTSSRLRPRQLPVANAA